MGSKKKKLNFAGKAVVFGGVSFLLGAASLVAALFIVSGNNNSLSSEQRGADDMLSSTADFMSDTDPSQEKAESENDSPRAVPTVNVYVDEEDSVTAPSAVKELICGYLREKYECLGSLSYRSLEDHFLLNDERGKLYSYFCNTSLDFLIFARASRRTDLSFESAEVGVTITECEKDNGSCYVKFLINDAICFAFTDKTSYSVGMEVEAVASMNSDNELKFKQYAEDTDVNILIESNVLERIGCDPDADYLKDVSIPENINIRSMFQSISEELKQATAMNIEMQNRMLDKFNASPSDFVSVKTADNQYNADKAIMYAYKWTGSDTIKRNPDYSDYSIYGGNCQNFVSQCLYESGIPMDWSGRSSEQQWKWFSDTVNTRETPNGRSTSWSGTEYFYDYCRNNTGSGLVAETGANLYSGNTGDVIQFVVDGWAHHSVIITDIVRDDSGNVVDFLITGNTTDRVDFPMSAYGYTDIRLIKIIGYN